MESVVDDFSGESDIIELDGGEIILHVRKCDVMKLEYMITQIEVSGSDKQVLGCSLGDDYNNIISKLDNIINGPEDVNMHKDCLWCVGLGLLYINICDIFNSNRFC